MRPAQFNDPQTCVDAVLARLGSRIVLATPLGLGKSVPLVNAFYERARSEPGIDLTIVTALTLQAPRPRSELEGRLLEPLVQRLYGGYPDARWVSDQRRGRVPANVRLREFFFAPGSRMDVEEAQRQYTSDNYTHVVRNLLKQGVNVLAQMVAPDRAGGGRRFSLSSNPDLSLDLLPHLRRVADAGGAAAVLGQLNPNLPYMHGDSEVSADQFDAVFSGPEADHPLFGVPNTRVSGADYAIALHATSLIRDGGTLQLGIGSMGDAVTRLLQLRQEDNATYRQLLANAGVLERYAELIEDVGGTGAFENGVYAATEMLVDGYLALYRSGVLKRRVYPHAAVQELINAGAMAERWDEHALRALGEHGVASPRMTPEEFVELRELGAFPAGSRLQDGAILLEEGGAVELHSADWAKRIAPLVDGRPLARGCIAHAGFFLGPHAFYRGLHELSELERSEIQMTRISYVNDLFGDERLKRAQRTNARFLNSGLMATLLGHVISDALEDGRVVSGVGGQYNFVAMAHALENGRSILMIRSTRSKAGRTRSNVVWNYGHCTIPRHLRDIVVTEYGIADLRGCSDEQCILRMLEISDSRFQEALLNDARRSRKISPAYRIPERCRNNVPGTLNELFAPLRAQGVLADFPYGTDLSNEEIKLAGALRNLAEYAGARRLPPGWWRNLGTLFRTPPGAAPYLQRMGLDRPSSPGEHLQRRLTVFALALRDII